MTQRPFERRPLLFHRLTVPETRADAVKECVRAFEAAGGTVTGAAIMLGVPHRTFCRWMHRWSSLREGIQAARAKILAS